MKKLLLFISTITTLVTLSCSTTRTTTESVLANSAVVQNAVESRRYIVKFERIYLMGGIIDLVPRMNYIIVDGQKAIINTAYFGRQYDIRPIAGINMKGVAQNYELTKKISKGLYEVSMKVENGSAVFDVYLTIGKEGTADASVNGMRINNIRYRGYLVPLSSETKVPLQDHRVI